MGRKVGALGVLLLGCVAALGLPRGRAQPELVPPPRQLKGPPDKADEGQRRPEQAGQRGRVPDYVKGLPPAVGVTLGDVLRLAALGNLDIAQARLLVERARIA